MTDTTQAHPQPLIENDSASHLEVGDFTVDTDTRTVRGLLMPWNSLSDVRHTNAPIAFVPGAVKPPADVSIVTANINHDRYRPVGRAVSVEVGERGLFATFSIARTPEGDEFLEDHRSGKRSLSKLSPELTAITRDPSDRTRGISAVLTGAAFTSQGAFAEAGLFSLDADDEETVADLLEARIADLEAQLAALAPKTPEDDESEDNPTPSPEIEEEEAVMSTVANTTYVQEKDTDLNGLFSLVREYKNAGFNESARREVEQGLFALADIHFDKTGTGNNSLGAPIRQPAFVGELWSGRSFARKVIPLINHGQLKAMNNTGYRFTQKPTVALWSGNKSEIPTSTGKIETYTYQAKRYAGGWDIAREYIDFQEMEVVEAFLRQAVNSYAEVTDAQALTDLVAASTNLVAGAPASGISEVMHKIVKGALGVINAGGTPTSAVVAPGLYEQLIFTKEVDRLAFLNASLGLEEGSVDSFRVVPHTGLTAGTALVLDKNAATAEELSETPIRVSAIDLARGGFDEALHGYYATRVDMSSAIVRVTTA